MWKRSFPIPAWALSCFEAAQYHDYNLLLVLCVLTGAVVAICALLAEFLEKKADPRMQREAHHA